MNAADFRQVLAAILIVGLLAPAAQIGAQEMVYKWVDDQGVVHFSETPPDESLGFEVEIVTTDRAPRYVPPPKPAAKSRPAPETPVVHESAPPQIQDPSEFSAVDITQMSLADLDRRCEAAREKKIAPMRAAQIAECIKAGTGDRAWCENFWADYGEPRRLASGGFTPRMFHDLPECIEALDERHRRVSR